MAKMTMTNVLTDAEIIANADTLAAIFAEAAGTANNKLTVQQAHQLAEGLKKAGFQISIPLQKGQL